MNSPNICKCILLYTQGELPENSEYQSWLLSHPLFLIHSHLNFEVLHSLLVGICSEPILLIELNELYRENGVFPPSKGAFRDLMRRELE